MSQSKKKVKEVFDKYKYYEKSVQNAETEIDFLNEKFLEIRKKKPLILREDFCGTGMVLCDWVKQSSKHTSIGIDLDPEPILVGKERHHHKLTADQQKRAVYLQDNVLNNQKEKADVTVAFNFSYFVFKKRKDLLEYFKMAKKSLKKDGVFFIDLFGGPDSQKVIEEQTIHPKFSYFWDCQEFNPITYECRFAIHFKVGGKKHKNCFTYDWRMWTLPELREILEEAGFSQTIAYWEGDDGKGAGNGVFTATEHAENCDAWVTYIAALP